MENWISPLWRISTICTDRIDLRRIDDPTAGYTKYLAQSKSGAIYNSSDFRKDMIFYEPNDKAVFDLFSDNIKQRNLIELKWDEYIKNNMRSEFYTLDISFDARSDKEETILDSFLNGFSDDRSREYSSFILQSIADITVKIIKDVYDLDLKIFIGVFHGEQVCNNNGIMNPHMHLLYC